MTIEERADAYVGHPEEIDEFTSATIKRDAYIRGAKEKKAIDGAEWMFEKAVNWLKENAQNYYKNSSIHDNCWYDDEQMIEDFQKAMEE